MGSGHAFVNEFDDDSRKMLKREYHDEEPEIGIPRRESLGNHEHGESDEGDAPDNEEQQILQPGFSQRGIQN